MRVGYSPNLTLALACGQSDAGVVADTLHAWPDVALSNRTFDVIGETMSPKAGAGARNFSVSQSQRNSIGGLQFRANRLYKPGVGALAAWRWCRDLRFAAACWSVGAAIFFLKTLISSS